LLGCFGLAILHTVARHGCDPVFDLARHGNLGVIPRRALERGSWWIDITTGIKSEVAITVLQLKFVMTISLYLFRVCSNDLGVLYKAY
jgi:hypothetical protein